MMRVAGEVQARRLTVEDFEIAARLCGSLPLPMFVRRLRRLDRVPSRLALLALPAQWLRHVFRRHKAVAQSTPERQEK
jgi:hypothetical protein